MYAEAAERRGVPRERILLEPRATNTAENIRFVRELLCGRGIRPRNLVLAVKPFMQRRVWATMAVEWPEMPATLASPELTLDQYFTAELPPEKTSRSSPRHSSTARDRSSMRAPRLASPVSESWRA